jgi:hypothetical protein
VPHQPLAVNALVPIRRECGSDTTKSYHSAQLFWVAAGHLSTPEVQAVAVFVIYSNHCMATLTQLV